MYEQREDRRALRTKRLLLDGLISLIHERGFESVTVQEIAERANVGRSTFYAHFSSKEELLLGGFDELEASLLDELRRSDGQRGGRREIRFAFSLPLLEHFTRSASYFRRPWGIRAGPPHTAECSSW